MRKLFAVTRHEFRAAAANKTFVIMTLLGPFLILAVTVLPSLMAQDPAAVGGGKPLAVVVRDDAAWDALSAGLSAQGLEALRVADPQSGKDAVLDGAYAGLVELPDAWPEQASRFYSRSGTEAALYGTVEAILGSYATEIKVRRFGLSQEQAASLLSRPGIDVVKLGADRSEESKTQDDFMGIMFTAIGFVMLIYMTVLLYGQMIGRSVVLEKTNKTVEIMLSSVSPRELMTGKILGLGLAGLLQYAVWLLMAAGMIRFVGPALHLAMPAAVSISNFLWLALFFVLGFFLYASAYAALGAAAEDEQHLGQLAWPLLFFLIVPMVTISAMVMNPGNPLAMFMSFFPLTSPIVMLVRILVSMPAWWELAICIGLLLSSVWAMSAFAAKVFRVGILMSGKRHKLSEIIRWSAMR